MVILALLDEDGAGDRCLTIPLRFRLDYLQLLPTFNPHSKTARLCIVDMQVLYSVTLQHLCRNISQIAALRHVRINHHMTTVVSSHGEQPAALLLGYVDALVWSTRAMVNEDWACAAVWAIAQEGVVRQEKHLLVDVTIGEASPAGVCILSVDGYSYGSCAGLGERKGRW